MRQIFFIFTLSFVACLSGCINLSGLKNAQSDFPCEGTDSTFCGSLTQAYEIGKNEVALPFPEVSQISSDTFVKAKLPNREPEKILMLYVAPFVDNDGDLHEGHFIHVTVRSARWQGAEMPTSVFSNVSREIVPLSPKVTQSNNRLPEK